MLRRASAYGTEKETTTTQKWRYLNHKCLDGEIYTHFLKKTLTTEIVKLQLYSETFLIDGDILTLNSLIEKDGSKDKLI